MKTYFYFVLIFLISGNIYAQNYFQQEVNYRIEVSLDDENHKLHGFESIEYINNSPDELTFIYFHLWPNAYKNKNTALAQQLRYLGKKIMEDGEEKDFGYIDSLDFMVNSKKVKIEYHEQWNDVCKVILNEPLKSGAKITISTPFRVKIPSGKISRLGHIDQSYQITQWYPKPAVYDLNGWHEMPYLNQGEFYSEFGSFDVSITLPKNYVVGATGNLQNKKELEWLNQKAEETAKLTSFSKGKEFPKSVEETKTLRYTENNIHDFAWFADKRYYVLKSEIELPSSKRKVTTWAMFAGHTAWQWEDAHHYVDSALYNYSLWNFDYPYDNCTAVLGALSAGGGMEYPTITIIGATSNKITLEEVIVHEVGHNWFYGILGFDERRYPFLDEGINTANEYRYMTSRQPEILLNDYLGIKEGWIANIIGFREQKFVRFYHLLYSVTAMLNLDQPCDLHSIEYTNMNYGTVVYMKMSVIVNTLRGYLGDEAFDRAMHQFFDEWKFKHPSPNDFRKVMEKSSGKDLSWFFDEMIATTKKTDYKIARVRNDKLLIKNKGQSTIPFNVSYVNNSDLTQWYDGFKGSKWVDMPKGNFDKIVLDKGLMMPEIYRHNNIYRTKGLLKKVEPLRFKFLLPIGDENNTQINYLPLVGGNAYNGFMAGAAFYSEILPLQKFNYFLAPMYGFGNNNLAGIAMLNYSFYPENVFERISIGTTAQRFGYEIQQTTDTRIESNYNALKNNIDFVFKKKRPTDRISNKLRFSYSVIGSPTEATEADKDVYNQFFTAAYWLHKQFDKSAVEFDAKLQGSNFGMAKFKGELKYRSKMANVRLFFGKIIDEGDKPAFSQLHISGTSGSADYEMNTLFMGRYENINTEEMTFAGRQFIANEGGFGIYSPAIFSNNSLFAINIDSKLPKLQKLPIALYANAGKLSGNNDFDDILYEAGIKFEIANKLLTVYFPLTYSKDFSDSNPMLDDNFGNRIRFSLKLTFIDRDKLITSIMGM